MNEYQKRKAIVREKAIRWQSEYPDQNYSWESIFLAGEYFAKLARKYGLVREFKENGII